MKFLDGLFREDETISPRITVICALLAFGIGFLASVAGMFTALILYLILLGLLVPVTYAALRYLTPLADPRHPDSDPVAVYGGGALALCLGFAGYGLVLLPALALGGAVLWMRAPELLEPLGLPARDTERKDYDVLS